MVGSKQMSMLNVSCAVCSGKHGSPCSEGDMQMEETFDDAQPLESVYSMNNMSHSLGLIPEVI